MPDPGSNRVGETGTFFRRDRLWHPPALTPDYKTSVLRSPQKALLAFDNTASEITGPVFGHAMLGELDADLIHNFAKPGESAIGERIIVHGRVLRSRATGATYEAAIDDVIDKVERQAVEYKEKPRLRARPEEEKQILRRLADGSEGPRREARIVKTKRFAIEPMFEEDAVAAMEELGHQFFVFVNAETERVAILYRRDDDDYGLIEPVVGGDYTQGRSHAPSAPERAATGRR